MSFIYFCKTFFALIETIGQVILTFGFIIIFILYLFSLCLDDQNRFKKLELRTSNATTPTNISRTGVQLTTSALKNRMSAVLHGKSNNIAVNVTNTANHNVVQQSNQPVAFIKTAGGQVYKVPISALQGKTVGQQLIIKHGPPGTTMTTTSATIISMNTMTTTPSPLGKTVTTVVSSNANTSSNIPGMVIRSVVGTSSNSTTGASPGQRIQIIRPVTPISNTIPSVKAPITTTQIRLAPPSTSTAGTSTPNNSSNSVNSTTSSATSTATTSTTANTPIQQFIQIPLRLPDGRTQTINLPLSMIASNQPVQIALNQTSQGSQVITVSQPPRTVQLATPSSTAVTQVTGQNVNNATTNSAASTSVQSNSTSGTLNDSTVTNAEKTNTSVNCNAQIETTTPSSVSNIVTASTLNSVANSAASATTPTSAGQVISNSNCITKVVKVESKSQVNCSTSPISSSPSDVTSGPPAKKMKMEKLADENLASEVCNLKKEIKDKQVLLEKQLYKDAQFSLEKHKLSLNNNSKVITTNNNHHINSSLTHITDYGDCKTTNSDLQGLKQPPQVAKQQQQQQQQQTNQLQPEQGSGNKKESSSKKSDFEMQDIPQIEEEVLISNDLVKREAKNDTSSYGESELYCLCRQPYDETQVYVGCDSCQGWFHCSCVGITQQQAEEIEAYFCPNCQKK